MQPQDNQKGINGFRLLSGENGSQNPWMNAFLKVGPALAELRERAGIQSAAEMARRLGVTEQQVRKWERDREDSNLETRTLDRYLSAINANAHDLAAALDRVNGRPTITPPTPGEPIDAYLERTIAGMAIRAQMLADLLDSLDPDWQSKIGKRGPKR